MLRVIIRVGGELRGKGLMVDEYVDGRPSSPGGGGSQVRSGFCSSDPSICEGPIRAGSSRVPRRESIAGT